MKDHERPQNRNRGSKNYNGGRGKTVLKKKKNAEKSNRNCDRSRAKQITSWALKGNPFAKIYFSHPLSPSSAER
jgi:hypothetical protein